MTKPQHKGTGFTLGVALGAIVGAGAIIAMGENNTKKVRDKFSQEFKDFIAKLKDKYPEQTEHFEQLVHDSFQELSETNAEIKQKAAEATAKAKTVADTLKNSKPPNKKKTFTKKGKNL